MKLGGVKKASEEKSESEPVKKYEKKVAKADGTGGNKPLAILLTVMGVVITGLIITIVVVVINRNNKEDFGDEYEDGEVAYASPVYESYDKLAEEFSIALAEMDNPTTAEILALYRTYIDRAENEEVRAMLMVDYYMIMMSGDLGGGQKTEILDGLVAADAIVKSVKSASAVVMAADLYKDEELKVKYQALADVRAFGDVEDEGDNDNEEKTTE
ncbi:hypothetical protein IJG27_00850 [Candidatus Saccharibacteria bacterium]|nr:hypothetical protein [Candidatus Saccharibacteria bacterium]